MRTSPLCPYPLSFVQRFWSKVAVCPHGETCQHCCWEWLAAKTRGGYGHLSVPKAYRAGTGKLRRANRVCWEIVYGPIPEGLLALHDCPHGDNPGCVNYWHLWCGTHEDNMEDCIRKGRNAKGATHGVRTHPEALHRGEAKHCAKVTTADILPMCYAAIAGATHDEIAAPLGVSGGAVGFILQRKNWRHISVPREVLEQLVNRPPALRPARGERVAGAKLTPSLVRVIRQEAREGIPYAQIASRHHTTDSNVSQIVRRVTWAWLPDAPGTERGEA